MNTFFLQTYTWNPWQNLAVEKYLSDQIHNGDIILYLWQNDHTVVIGKNQNALRECKAGLLEKEGGFLARRTTGGGAVYHDLGNLCFTFLADPELYDLEKQLSVIQNACRKFGIETFRSGRNDLITADGFKFSGNAFSKTSSCSIQHGTLMLDVDKSMLERYLIPSVEKLKSKGVKSVRSRVCNLKELNPAVTIEAMRLALQESFEEIYGAFTELDPKILENDTVHTTRELYASWEWRYGKSPSCETSFQKRFDWGEIQIYLKLDSLQITEIQIFSDALDTELPALLEQFLRGRRFDETALQQLLLPTAQSADSSTETAASITNPCSESQKEMIAQVVRWLISCLEN